MARSIPTSDTISNRAVEIMAEQMVFTQHTGEQARAEYMKRRANRDELTQGFSWKVSFDGDRLIAGRGTGPEGAAFGSSTDPDRGILARDVNGKSVESLRNAVTADGYEANIGGVLQRGNEDYQRLWGRFYEEFKFRFFPGFGLTEAEVDKTWFQGSSKAFESACSNLATQIDLFLAREARIGGCDALPPISPGNTDFVITTDDGQKNVRTQLTSRRLGWIPRRLAATGWIQPTPERFKLFCTPTALHDLSTVAKLNRLPEAMESQIMQRGYAGVYAGMSFVETNHARSHTCGTRAGFYADAVPSGTTDAAASKRAAITGNRTQSNASPARNALGNFSGTNDVAATNGVPATAANADAVLCFTCTVEGEQKTADAVTAGRDTGANFMHEQRLRVADLAIDGGDFKAGDHFVIDGVWAINRTTYERVRQLQVFTVLADATAAVATAAGDTNGLIIHPRIISGGAHQNVEIAASSTGGVAAGTLDGRRIQFYGREGATYEQLFGYDKDLLQTAYELVINNPRGADGGDSMPIGGVDVSTKAIKETGMMLSVVRDFDIDSAQTKTRLDMAISARSVQGAYKGLALYGEEVSSPSAYSGFGVG